jgi:tetratricopeptide (TPR) repeat protein
MQDCKIMAQSATSSYFDSQEDSSNDVEQQDHHAKHLEVLRGLLDAATDLRNQGNIYYKAKDYYNAIRLYSQSIKSIPSEEFKGYFTDECNEIRLKSFTNIVRCCNVLGQYLEAISYCTLGLQEFPRAVPLMYLCAAAYEKLERYDEAVQVLKVAKMHEPGNSQVLASLNQCLVRAK